jgi:16S rRNA (cytosine1402-N4)-methyltransferase
MSEYHIPVLLKESIDGLNITRGGIYVDATFGGGGHSGEILKRLDRGQLYAFDQDEDVIRNVPDNKKFFFIQGNFRFLKNYLKYYGVYQIDGLIADLGVSSHHFDEAGRGFTYRSNAVLDMRMNRYGKLTAEMVINDYEADKITAMFRHFGEIQHPHKLTAAIIRAREKNRITTVNQLISCFELPPSHSGDRKFLSKVFQAIRIEVNHELESLKDLLYSAGELLKSGGRLVMISYHSLEDRYVKNYMRWGNVDEEPVKDLYGNKSEPFFVISRKPVIAGDSEVAENSRARSARLRIAEKK